MMSNIVFNERVRLAAMAFNNLGTLLAQSGETAMAVDDFAAVLGMPEAPTDQKARALVSRGWTLFTNRGDVHSLVDDSRKALELEEGNVYARMNLGLGILLTGDIAAARAEYETLWSRTSSAAVIQAAIDDLEAALSKRVEIPGAAEILDGLRNAVRG